MTSNREPLPQTGWDGDNASCLSAWVDGDSRAADAACSRWRDEAEARRTWHAYHLIGDVMRSEELASTSTHDAEFLASLRLRLVNEPVVLAPPPVSAAAPASVPARRQAWLLPVAAAAGFVMVAGVLLMTRVAAPDASGGDASAGARLAVAEIAPAASSVASPVAVTASTAGAPVDGNRLSASVLVRDARLDDYLRAHQAAGGMAAATPGGWLRQVDNRVAAPSQR